MKIYFKTKKLQKQCSEMREMVRVFGQAMADKLSQRLAELHAADSLAEITPLPPPRCHELTNRKGVFSVNLVHPYRLLFISADGGIKRDSVFEVEIIAIEDTHDKKNQRRR